MISRFVLTGVVIGLLGAEQTFGADGNNAFAPIGGNRTKGMITAGSLYKNQPANQSAVRPVNSTLPGSTPSTMPQNTAFSQPTYKPTPLSTPQQQPQFTTMPQTTVSGSLPSYTPSYTPLQTTPQPTPVYTTGRPTPVAQPSPYPAMVPNPSFATPAQQPIYSIAPQFGAVSPLPSVAQPGPYSMTPSSKPIYTMGQQSGASQPSVPGASQTGPFSTSYQSFSLTSPQNTLPMQFQYAPLLSPIAVPISTPLTVPLQQPLSPIPPAASPSSARQTQPAAPR